MTRSLRWVAGGLLLLVTLVGCKAGALPPTPTETVTSTAEPTSEPPTDPTGTILPPTSVTATETTSPAAPTSTAAGTTTAGSTTTATARPTATTTTAAATRTTTPARPPATTTPPPPVVTTTPAQPSTPPAGGPHTPAEQEVLNLVNQERSKNGCQPLQADARLVNSARGHSQDMAAKNYFDHTSRDGRDPFQRMRDAGYPRAGGENIAAGYRSPKAVMDGWMTSPGHRSNILKCGYKAIGVGFAAGGSFGSYWTQNFGF